MKRYKVVSICDGDVVEPMQDFVRIIQKAHLLLADFIQKSVSKSALAKIGNPGTSKYEVMCTCTRAALIRDNL